MVDQHASQCGFCTPGFVMSLFALYMTPGAARRERKWSMPLQATCAAARTGYRPIIEAGCRMSSFRAARQLETAAPPSEPEHVARVTTDRSFPTARPSLE